jgi:hypothetical protein
MDPNEELTELRAAFGRDYFEAGQRFGRLDAHLRFGGDPPDEWAEAFGKAAAKRILTDDERLIERITQLEERVARLERGPDLIG